MKNHTEMPTINPNRLAQALFDFRQLKGAKDAELVEIKPCWDNGVVFITDTGARYKWHMTGMIGLMPNWKKEN